MRVSFPGHAGNQLSGIVDEPGEGVGKVVLFTHCFTCNKDLKAIVRISRRLAELGYTVLRYDWSGLGQSQGTFTETSFTTGLADLQAAAKYCGDNIGGPDFLLGYSLGGIASLVSAAKIATVQGVATIGSPDDTWHLADLLERMDPQIASTGHGEVEIGGRRWEIRQPLVDDLRNFPVERALKDLTKPVLLFHSLVDETVLYSRAVSLLKRLQQNPGLAASLITLPKADHLLTNDPADIEFVAQILGHWLQSSGFRSQVPGKNPEP